jgi:hypothetical protein
VVDIVKDRSALDKICAVLEHQHRDAYERIVSSNEVRLAEYKNVFVFQTVSAGCSSSQRLCEHKEKAKCQSISQSISAGLAFDRSRGLVGSLFVMRAAAATHRKFLLIWKFSSLHSSLWPLGHKSNCF